MDPIINRARALFPMNEYGRAGMLTHPGARICPVALGKDTDIMFISNTPRSLRNGRYYPGWDCFEASFYLANQLKHKGAKPEFVISRTPIYNVDVAVLIGDTLISITPGVPTFQEFSFSRRSDYFKDHLDFWRAKKRLEISLSDHMILGWEDLGGFSFLSSCGMNILKGDILRAFVMSFCISEGNVLCEGHRSFDVPFSGLDEVKRRAGSDDPSSVFDRLKLNSWTELYDLPGAKEQGESLATERVSVISQDVIPKMFRILDTDWFNRQVR